MQIELTGKTLFITGGRGGIGSAICDRFKACGANVIAPSSKELNLASEDSMAAYFEGNDISPDYVIHSAGVNELAGITEITQEVMGKVFQVNLFSFAMLLKRFVPDMQRRGFGRIVGISSLYGIVSRELRIPYSSSKHALSGLIKSTALELAGQNILVNGVAPGYVMTEMTRANLSPQEIEAIRQQIPTGRLQQAVEIADLCLFLCSPMNQSITGQIIPVDGGFVCR